MMLFDFNAYVAEFQIAVMDRRAGTVTISPSRPASEFEQAIKARRGAFVAAILFTGFNLPCVYDERRWVEGRWALGRKYQVKHRNSKVYKKLVDALLTPTPAPVVFEMAGSGWRRLRLGGG